MNHGKNELILIQVADNELNEDSYMIGNQTESTYAIENELVDEQTKNGRNLEYGNNSESVEVTCYGDKDDNGQTELERAIKKKRQVKVWMLNKNLNKNGNHDARFGYALVESYEETAAADSFVELASTLQFKGETVKGELPPLPQSVLELGAYGFEKPGDSTGDWGSAEHTYAEDPSVTAPTLSKGTVKGTSAVINIAGGQDGDIYTIYQDDKRIVSTTDASYVVKELTKSTTYNFTATIRREGKTSPKSTKLSVTTEAK